MRYLSVCIYYYHGYVTVYIQFMGNVTTRSVPHQIVRALVRRALVSTGQFGQLANSYLPLPIAIGLEIALA